MQLNLGNENIYDFTKEFILHEKIYADILSEKDPVKSSEKKLYETYEDVIPLMTCPLSPSMVKTVTDIFLEYEKYKSVIYKIFFSDFIIKLILLILRILLSVNHGLQ